MGENISLSSDIWLSDMSNCIPKHALSRRRKKYHWQLIDYEAEGGLEGVLLNAGPETDAPDIVFPLNLSGWHSIYVGIWGRKLGEELDFKVKVRLKDDPCFVTFTREKPSYSTIEEGFWKHADLTGQHLVIGQQKSGYTASASLAYVRLTSLSDEEVERIHQDRIRKDTKRLIAANDSFSDLFRKRPTTKKEISEMVEPYRFTDFKKVFLEIGSGGWFFGRGRLYGEGVEDFPRVGDRFVAESIQILLSKGINPLKTAMEHAHSMGLEFHVSQRVELYTSPIFEESNDEFYGEHPEYRLIDRDGTEITGLSYAYPEVRKYFISLLKEAASYGADGAVVIYVRAPPIILYEKPLVEGFQKRYGIDPRTLDERDEKWLQYRASFITQFMRELRQGMDEVGEELGRRLETSAITLATGDENTFYGLDVDAWVKEGLIDNLIPYPCRGDKSEEEIDMGYYAKVTKGTGCKLYPNVMPRRMPAEEFRSKAQTYYQAGADGLFFWDTNVRHDTTAMWDAIRRLGHVDELEEWAKKEKREEMPRTTELLKLGGHTMRRYSPFRGG